MINPHHFSDTNSNKIDYASREVTNILLVGHSPSRSSLKKLYNSLDEMSRSDYVITIVGKSVRIPKRLSERVKSAGRVSFKELYDFLQRADFILTTFDENLPNDSRYLQGTTSGSLQLSLGFNKPLIINERFAKQFHLSGRNSVIYEGEFSTAALQEALRMSDVKYSRVLKGLSRTSRKWYKESRKNLKDGLRLLKKKGAKKVYTEDASTIHFIKTGQYNVLDRRGRLAKAIVRVRTVLGRIKRVVLGSFLKAK